MICGEIDSHIIHHSGAGAELPSGRQVHAFEPKKPYSAPTLRRLSDAEVETLRRSNRFMVGSDGDPERPISFALADLLARPDDENDLRMLDPRLRRRLSTEQAINLAAWLVAIVPDGRQLLGRILDEIERR